MNEHIRRAGRYAQEALQESLSQARNEYGDEKFRRGFKSAAAITQRTIEARIEALKDQMKHGPRLTQAEQALFVKLDELKAEIEAECDRYWAGSGVDWRPITPVVGKGQARLAHTPEATD